MLKKFFTEEGRTRLKNAGRRYAVYALVWLVLSLAAGVGTYFVYVRGNLTPMQRIYLPQYFTSAWRSSLRGAFPLVSKSYYVVLVGETYDSRTKQSRYRAVTEDVATAALDADGYVARGRDGMPRLLIREGAGYRRVFWNRTLDGDARRYEFFREGFFEGQSFTKMLAPSLAAFHRRVVCGPRGGRLGRRSTEPPLPARRIGARPPPRQPARVRPALPPRPRARH